jgi:hypothetical protein
MFTSGKERKAKINRKRSVETISSGTGFDYWAEEFEPQTAAAGVLFTPDLLDDLADANDVGNHEVTGSFRALQRFESEKIEQKKQKEPGGLLDRFLSFCRRWAS